MAWFNRLQKRSVALEPQHRGQYVELVGAPAVGKSSTVALAKENLTGDWKDSKYLRSFARNSQFDVTNSYAHELILKKVNSYMLRSNFSLVQRLKTTRHNSTIMVQDIAAIRYLQSDHASSSSVVLLDEGLCHNFGAALVSTRSDVVQTILKNRALVFIKPKRRETVIERMAQRKKRLPLFAGLDDTSVSELSRTIINNVEALHLLAVKLGLTHLTLTAEDSLPYKADRLCGFLSDLRSDQRSDQKVR